MCWRSPFPSANLQKHLPIVFILPVSSISSGVIGPGNVAHTPPSHQNWNVELLLSSCFGLTWLLVDLLSCLADGPCEDDTATNTPHPPVPSLPTHAVRRVCGTFSSSSLVVQTTSTADHRGRRLRRRQLLVSVGRTF